MPKGPKGQRRPADVIGAAVHVARIATGELAEDTKTDRPGACSWWTGRWSQESAGASRLSAGRRSRARRPRHGGVERQQPAGSIHPFQTSRAHRCLVA